MSLSKIIEKVGKANTLFIARHSLGVIMILFGSVVTLLFMIGYLIKYFFENSVYSLNGALESIVPPFIAGLIIVPIFVIVITSIFKELEETRLRLIDLEKKESLLKSNLAKTYIDIINQREQNSLLSKDHRKLLGSLDNEITQRMETQQKLEEQVSFFSAIINLTPDIIIYRDNKGNVTGCNDNLQRLLSVNNKEELVVKFKQQPQLEEIFTRLDAQVLGTKNEVTYEATIGDVFFQMRKRPVINSRGGLIGIITYGNDITKLKNEQDILEKASREKSNFISTLSHELRTPLNGIVGLSDILLNSGRFKDEDMRHLRAINVNAVTLGNIFNDVIDLNKLERKTFNVVYESVQWPNFLESLEILVSLMAKQKGLDFNYKQVGEIPKIITTDPTRLRQILWNLSSNAVKFTKEGCVSLSALHKIENGRLKIQFKVEDTGIGIALDEQKKIFDLYYQVAGTKQSTGTGIGLHVTENFCKALGGEISVTSVLNKGSCFTVDFDFEILDKLENKQDEKVNKSKLSVLLVEDVDLNILVAKTMLEKLGHSVVAAKTGFDALKEFSEKQIDLVLLDMQLPDMTGLDIADKLVAQYNCSVPMIALTANVVADSEIYKQHNIIGVMSKPLTSTKLEQTLNKL